MDKNKTTSITDIADSLGLSFTTACKIINSDPKYKVSKDTREKVLKKAKEMNYDFSRLFGRYRREHNRKKVRIPIKIRIRIKKTARLWNEGRAEIKNISEGGVTISKLKLKRARLPVVPFMCEMEVTSGRLKGCQAIGDPIRITTGGNIDLVIKFGYVTPECKEKILGVTK